jgi:hypothetical protein
VSELVRVSSSDELTVAVHERARVAAAEAAYPDFTETLRPSRMAARPGCAAPGCDNPLPPGTRADRQWCSERCAHRIRQQRYRAALRAAGRPRSDRREREARRAG